MAELSALPALSIHPFNVLSAIEDVDEYKAKQEEYKANQAVMPGKIQAENEKNAFAHTEYGNNMLEQAATESLAADPDEAPLAWDNKMRELSSNGVPGARQYIGRYTPETAKRVQSAFSTSKPGAGAHGANTPVDTKFQAQIAQMNTDQIGKSLGLANTAISSWNKIASNPNATPDDLRAEVKELQAAGINVAQAVPGLDLSRTDPIGFHQNYAALARAVDAMVPKRDALQEASISSALGVPVLAINPADNIRMSRNDILINKNTGKILYQPPASTSTGGAKKSAYDLTDEENDALTTGIANGTIDAGRVNSRTAKIFADIALKNSDVNLVNSAGHAAMVRNAAYQRIINVAEALPTVLENLREAGKKLNYNDIAFVGKLQAFKNKQLNDPDFVNYMTQRNDALLSIANVMRGVGMSDKATEMEEQASNPSMSPRAIDAYINAQEKSLAPRLAQYRKNEIGDIVNANEPVLPHPKTPQEAAKLPKGTKFIDPSGKTRMVQ